MLVCKCFAYTEKGYRGDTHEKFSNHMQFPVSFSLALALAGDGCSFVAGCVCNEVYAGLHLFLVHRSFNWLSASIIELCIDSPSVNMHSCRQEREEKQCFVCCVGEITLNRGMYCCLWLIQVCIIIEAFLCNCAGLLLCTLMLYCELIGGMS